MFILDLKSTRVSIQDLTFGSSEEIAMNPASTSESQKAAEEAVRLFESKPEFVRIALHVRQNLEEIDKQHPPEAGVFATEPRLKLVMERFEIRAKAFLELVSDLDTQNAFIAILRSISVGSFEEYTGFPEGQLIPVGMEKKRVDALRQLVPKWEKAGYERLAKESVETVGPEIRESGSLESVAQQRRKAVDLYIVEVEAKTGRRITRSDIWRSAGYSEATQFERWEKNIRGTAAAERRISQVLRAKPHMHKG
jgi:hypothetical protein